MTSPRPSLDRAGVLRAQLHEMERFLDDARSLLVPVWRDLALVQRFASDDARTLSTVELGTARELLDERFELVFLGVRQERAIFAVDISTVPDPLALPALATGHEAADLRLAAGLLPEQDASLAMYARGLLLWHRRHGYCAACGARSAPQRGGHVRVCTNDTCRAEHFPRTDPAVIMLVTDDADRCLIGRQRGWPPGMYSTLAGFVEPGETLEEAVAREVEEETAVRVTDVRYFASQPWPFPASIMIGFVARATSTDLRIDPEELEDARWVTRAQLQDSQAHGFWTPTRYSLASKLLRRYLDAPLAGPPSPDSPIGNS